MVFVKIDVLQGAMLFPENKVHIHGHQGMAHVVA
jgi:hypothetical protein